MGPFSLIKWFLHQLIIVVHALLWVVIMPTLLLVFSPFHIYRKFVFIYARKYRKDLGKMVTARSTLMAVDDMHGKPECNVVIWFTLKGDVTVKSFQTGFTERVLNLRDPASGSLLYPELRQYYKNSMGFLFWKWDENFNLNNHIKICEEVKHLVQGPQIGTGLKIGEPEVYTDYSVTEEQMIRVNEKLLSKPWPINQSPWEFLLVPNYDRNNRSDGSGVDPTGEKKTLVIFHLHHGMGDGYSFLKMILNHMAGQKMWKVAKPKSPGTKGSICRNTLNTLTFPLRVPYDFSKQCLDGYDINAWHLSESALTRKLRVAKTKRIPIKFIKEIKDMYNVSFSAVLFAATAGGLRNHLIESGFAVPNAMHVFIPMPFPNHPENKLRNHLTGCLGKLPLGKATARERLESCHRHFESLRNSTLPLSNFYLALIGGALPRFMKDVGKNYHATGIWSNFPGNEEKIYILGNEVLDFSYNVASLHGRTGFTFTVLSYGDNVSIDLTIDRVLAPTAGAAQDLISKIREEFNVLWRQEVV